MKHTLYILIVLAALACGQESSDAPALSGAEGMDPDNPGDWEAGSKGDEISAGWPGAAPLPGSCSEATALRTLFAPTDPTVSQELAEIDRVRAARAAAEGSWAEGENPYRIRYAVYNMSHDSILRSLTAAEAEGVDVQVLIEADQLHKEWNHTDDRFLEAGLHVVRDYDALTPETTATADLIGIDEPGLMHFKIRLFETPDETTLLTGSLNPNQSSAANEENLHLIRDPALVASYAAAYDAVLYDTGLQNSWAPDASMNVLFAPAATGPRAADKLLDWLAEEEEQILLMVFSLRDVSSPNRDRSLVEVLAERAAAGVDVVVITDRKQSDGVDLQGNKVFWDDTTDEKLRDAGIPVYEVMNDAFDWFGYQNPYCAMHHKSAILGRTRLRVITDASNWTAAAMGSWKKPEKNVESQLFIDSTALDDGLTGRRYLAQWVSVFERYGGQGVELDGEAPPGGVLSSLMAHPDWPKEPVTFEAVGETQWGEDLYVAGDLPELGGWGTQGDGVLLLTGADTYPLWQSRPVELPVGAWFEWKLVARSGHSVRWEGGRNRLGRSTAPVCGPALQTGIWQP